MNTVHPYWLILLALGCALVPVAIGMMTSYLKVSIVLGMIKNALGVQHAPGVVAEMALSLAITFYVMSPVLEKVNAGEALADLDKLAKIPSAQAIEKLAPLWEPWKVFLQTHSGEREIAMLLTLESSEKTKETEETGPPSVLAPRVLVTAFVLTELKEAFSMAFAVLLPFLVIDLIVANILTGMGMFMVSPTMISLPLKLLLFVMADGWMLLTRGLILSYGAQ